MSDVVTTRLKGALEALQVVIDAVEGSAISTARSVTTGGRTVPRAPQILVGRACQLFKVQGRRLERPSLAVVGTGLRQIKAEIRRALKALGKP